MNQELMSGLCQIAGREHVYEKEPMSRHTTFRIGGPADFFVVPQSPETLADVTKILEQNRTVTQIYRVSGKSRLHVHAVSSSNEEMEELICQTMDRLPGILSCSCNVILSRIKDIKGLRL